MQLNKASKVKALFCGNLIQFERKCYFSQNLFGHP